MFPNININDRVLVLKDELYEIDYSIGDVIVFYSPESSTPNNSELLIENLKLWKLVNNKKNINQTVYIKRIIGTPGDEISINKNGQVFNNDIQVITENVASTIILDEIVIKLSDDEYFVLGDNRDNSFDSRLFGPITSSRIIGKAFFKIYPLDQIQNLND